MKKTGESGTLVGRSVLRDRNSLELQFRYGGHMEGSIFLKTTGDYGIL